jgi:hypothetical protein
VESEGREVQQLANTTLTTHQKAAIRAAERAVKWPKWIGGLSLLPQEHTDLIRGSVLQAQVLVPGLFSHR